jgi:hypothetical protein
MRGACRRYPRHWRVAQSFSAFAGGRSRVVAGSVSLTSEPPMPKNFRRRRALFSASFARQDSRKVSSGNTLFLLLFQACRTWHTSSQLFSFTSTLDACGGLRALVAEIRGPRGQSHRVGEMQTHVQHPVFFLRPASRRPPAKYTLRRACPDSVQHQREPQG